VGSVPGLRSSKKFLSLAMQKKGEVR